MDIVIAVIGGHSTGKTSFIEQLEKNPEGPYDDKEYTVTRFSDPNGRKVVFLDTPGANYSISASKSVLDKIQNFLHLKYGDSKKLDGLVYLQNIVKAPEIVNKTILQKFQDLCGTDDFKKVVVLTTHWDKDKNQKGPKQEETLKLRRLKGLADAHAHFMRHDNTPQSASDVLEHLFTLLLSSQSPFNGTRRRIVLAFDVGTVYSRITYSILDPGQCPSTHGVTRFPAAEVDVASASKVPSIIYYDKKGDVKAIGAEAVYDSIDEDASEYGWYKAEWFKFHLRSKYTPDEHDVGRYVPPLPPNKTVVDVFADYFRYLLRCAASYIEDNHPDEPDLWSGARDDMHFVLTHPNGWEGKEQSQMRNAAVNAGLVPDDPSGHSRLSFVTNGEHSLHVAIESGILSDKMEGFVIVDAGGGTIDVSAYERTNGAFREIAVSQCYFQGSVFVTFQAREFLTNLLVGSSFEDDLDRMCSYFDKTTKIRFYNPSDPQRIKFGLPGVNDSDLSILRGHLKLAGVDIAEFFQPSIDCIVQAVMEQQKAGHKKISHVIMVGGFAASDYLSEQVKAQLTKAGLTLVRPGYRVNETVSHGGISFFLDHYVRSRVAKASYGSSVYWTYDNGDPEHIKRAELKVSCPDGGFWIPGGFYMVLAKNTQVSETKEFARPIRWVSPVPQFTPETTVLCYRGSQTDPKWVDSDPANFQTLCTLRADVSDIPKTEGHNPAGEKYYSVELDVVMKFGLTELQAQLRWFENGVERRSNAQLIFADDD